MDVWDDILDDLELPFEQIEASLSAHQTSFEEELAALEFLAAD